MSRLFQYLKLAALGGLLHVCSSCSPEDTVAPRPPGPTQALIEKAVHQWGGGNFSIVAHKRGATLVSTAGGVLPENTTVFPVQIGVRHSHDPQAGDKTIVLYFFQDEFEQWQFFPKDYPERMQRIE
jgi:hypothetical protein